MTLTVAAPVSRAPRGRATAGISAGSARLTASPAAAAIGRTRCHVCRPGPAARAAAARDRARGRRRRRDRDRDAQARLARRRHRHVVDLEREVVPSVGTTRSRRRPDRYAGADDHPFPGCFVCGPDRAEGDGLRLFPGGLGPGRTACTWRRTVRRAMRPASSRRRSCGRRSTARAGGRRTSAVGRWCSAR